MSYHLNFQTEYSQFYICDEKSPKKTDYHNFWTTEAYNDRLAIGDGILGIGTECYGHVKGVVVLFDKENRTFNKSESDHIVEGGLNIKSGHLEVLDCPYSSVELKVKVNPGNYRVRIYSSNLRSVKGDEGNDYYNIEIWPENGLERKVLKRYIDK